MGKATTRTTPTRPTRTQHDEHPHPYPPPRRLAPRRARRDQRQGEGRDQRLWPHRKELPQVSRGSRLHGPRGRRRERLRRSQAGFPPPQVRLDARNFRRGRPDQGRYRHLCERQGHHRRVQQGPPAAPLEGDGRGPRDRGNRSLPQQRGRGQAHHRGREEGSDHRPRQGKRHPHPRRGREREGPRHERPDRVQRIVHHQLPRPLRQGAGGEVRNRQGPDDHDPLLHRGPEAPRCLPQGHEEGKLTGIALRVPTPNVSVVDLVIQVEKKTFAEEVNAAFREAADTYLNGVLDVTSDPLVSCDFRCSDVSTTIDSSLTMVMGDDMVKVVAWYDNEWGYSQRVVDLAELMSKNL